MNLRDLQYVRAVAEHGSFTRAAQVASVSQPALSNQIKKLEAELGQDIFVRAKFDVHLTPFGEALIVHATDIQRSVDQMESLAKQFSQKKAGTIRIGTTPTLASYLAGYLRGLFAETHPNVRLIMSEAYPEALANMVSDGSIDIAFIARKTFETIQSSRSQPMNFAPLWDEALYLAVRDAHPLTDGAGILAHDVPADLLIRFSISFGYELEARLPSPTGEAADIAGIDMQTARFETVCRQIAFCDACTIVNAVAAEKLKRDGLGLSFVPFLDHDSHRVLGAMTRVDAANAAVVEKMRDYSLTASPEGTTPAR